MVVAAWLRLGGQGEWSAASEVSGKPAEWLTQESTEGLVWKEVGQDEQTQPV